MWGGGGVGRGVARQETCPFALLRAVGRRKKFQFFFVSNGGLVVLVETALKAWVEAFNKADLPSKLRGWEIIQMHFFFFLSTISSGPQKINCQYQARNLEAGTWGFSQIFVRFKNRSPKKGRKQSISQRCSPFGDCSGKTRAAGSRLLAWWLRAHYRVSVVTSCRPVGWTLGTLWCSSRITCHHLPVQERFVWSLTRMPGFEFWFFVFSFFPFFLTSLRWFSSR